MDVNVHIDSKNHLENEVLDILGALIKYKTITPREDGIYEYIKSLLPDFKYICINEPCHDDGSDITKNIFLYKLPSSLQHTIDNNAKKQENANDIFAVFKDESLKNIKHLCLAGHIDVVSAGDISKWKCDPFTPTIINENEKSYLYGRGSQDMKGGIACFITAIRKFLQNFDNDDFIISILLTSDEEGEATFGTKYMLEKLLQNNIKPTHAIVAEPTSAKSIGDIIKIGRRGSINGEIILRGTQGHVAYPNLCKNPIDLLAPRLAKISGINLCNGDAHFLPSKLVITNLFAGVGATNVVPGELKIMFNVRNSTKVNKDFLQHYIDEIFAGLNYTLTLKQSAQPFITQDEFLINLVKNAIEKTCNISPKLDTGGGTSDARFFHAFGIAVLEIGLSNDTIHAINERVEISELEKLSGAFLEILKNYNGNK